MSKRKEKLGIGNSAGLPAEGKEKIAEQYKFFSAQDLLKHTYEELNASVWTGGIEMIQKIQEHFRGCKECRDNFDAMKYESFDQFEKLLSNSKLEDWIIQHSARVEFEKDRVVALMEYEKIVNPAMAKCERIEKSARAEYDRKMKGLQKKEG